MSDSDTDNEYEILKAKLKEFDTVDSEIEDFEDDEEYLNDIDALMPLSIDENSELKELGVVYSVVDGILIVQSTSTSVLEPGAVAVLPNRKPIGIIGDTFGPVENPFYSVKISDNSMLSFFEPDLPILYCPNNSKACNLKELESSDSENEEDDN